MVTKVGQQTTLQGSAVVPQAEYIKRNLILVNLVSNNKITKISIR